MTLYRLNISAKECLIALSIAAISAVAETGSGEAYRMWTDHTGKFSIEAVCVRFEDAAVRLKKRDEAEVLVPLVQLSKADQEFVILNGQSRPVLSGKVETQDTSGGPLSGDNGELDEKAMFRQWDADGPSYGYGALAQETGAGRLSNANSAPDEKAVQRRLEAIRKKIEGLLRRGKGNVFVVALMETQYHKNVVRRLPRSLLGRPDGLFLGDSTEHRSGSPGEFFPVPNADFVVVEGKEAVIQTITTHMSKYIRASSEQPRRMSVPKPPPSSGNWQLVGRFEGRGVADVALQQAQTLWQRQPHWEVDHAARE